VNHIEYMAMFMYYLFYIRLNQLNFINKIIAI